SVVPRNDTRTSAQNRYFHGVPCKYLAEYLRAQDASMSPFAALVIAKGTLKDQIIRTPTICKGTGELIGSYVPSTADLSVDAMSDLIERSRVWLLDTLNIQTPDAGRWVEPPAVATAGG